MARGIGLLSSVHDGVSVTAEADNGVSVASAIGLGVHGQALVQEV